MRDRQLIRRSDRGATLVIMAAFLVVAVIAVAAVTDIGGLRAEKKEVTLSTDAAAIAAAESIDYSDPAATGNNTLCSSVRSTDTRFGPTVEDVAVQYLTVNGESLLQDCRIYFGTPGMNQAYVTVQGTDDVEYNFGQAIGADGGTAFGTSSARTASAFVGNVYPIGVCAQDSPGAGGFINPSESFPQFFNGAESVTLDFGNSNCSASGNHDQIDFTPNLPPASSCTTNIEGKFTCDIFNSGFDGVVPPTVQSNPGGGGWNPLSAPLEDLRDRQVHIWVPVVGDCNDVQPASEVVCTGNPAKYPVEYLMEVVIDRFDANGGNAGFDFDVYQVVDYDYYEDNGLPLTTVQQQVQTNICATTDDLSGCTNNPPPPAPPPPPPPPVPCQVNSVTTDPSPEVDVNVQGELTGDLEVTATVDVLANCGSLTLEAVAGATVIPAPNAPTQNGNQFTFEFPSGTTFSPVNGTSFTMRVTEDATVRHSSTSVTVRAPTCSVSDLTPRPTVAIPYTQTGNGNNAVRRTNAAQAWQVTIDTPSICGAVTGKLVTTQGNQTFELNLVPPATLTSVTTWTLPANTQIPNGGQGRTWNVRFYNNGNVINGTAPANTATATFTAP